MLRCQPTRQQMRWLLCCVTALAIATSAYAAAGASLLGNVPVQQQCPKLRIAIVNGVAFHFEPYERHVDVYLSPWIKKPSFDGAWTLFTWSQARFYSVQMWPKAAYDLVILVSADYEVEQNERLIHQLQPRRILAMVHNGRSQHLPRLLSLMPEPRLIALAPHVAASAAAAVQRSVEWLLAVMPHNGSQHDCANSLDTMPPAQLVGGCFAGFSMQGKFSTQRRNYSSLWTQMQAHVSALADGSGARLLHMNVLGKGRNRLGVPPGLEAFITVHHRLKFQEFYSVIQHTLALVPSLASVKYLTEKFSSTIITSLCTGTPVLASRALSKAYSFLTPAATLVQNDDEQEVAAMIRVVSMPPSTVVETRRAVAQLRDELNAAALAKLEVHIRELCETVPAASA